VVGNKLLTSETSVPYSQPHGVTISFFKCCLYLILAVFTYKRYIPKTFDEVSCCPFTKASCCTHKRCCREGEICCPASPAEPTYCCPANYPHCAAGRMCSRDGTRDSHMIKGNRISEKSFQ